MAQKKIAVAGKIAPNLYKKVEQFQKAHKIKTKSKALELILEQYFSSTDNRQVTLGLPQDCEGDNRNLWLISELERIEEQIERIKGRVER